MPLNILYSDSDANWLLWKPHLENGFATAGIEIDLHRSYANPENVDYVIYSPASPLQDFSSYTKLKAVLSTWAGVETIEGNRTLTVPLARMVDPGLTEGMVEYVVGHVLRHHLDIDTHINPPDHSWRVETSPPLARSRNVGILGIGALGAACASALLNLNFKVHGWSRNPKNLDGVTCYNGTNGLSEILSKSDILVTLLPLTDDTRDLLDCAKLQLLPKNACIINPGRGPLIVDEDLLFCLDNGTLKHATLDVFRTEPLPQDHPFWTHPKITVTPHIAAETRAETAAGVIVANVKRCEAGEPLLYLVDRYAGY